MARLAGCGCIGPVIGAVETFGALILVPAAIVVGGIAVAVALCLLYVLFRFFRRQIYGGAEMAVNIWDGDPQKQSRLVNYVRRNHSVFSVVWRPSGILREAF